MVLQARLVSDHGQRESPSVSGSPGGDSSDGLTYRTDCPTIDGVIAHRGRRWVNWTPCLGPVIISSCSPLVSRTSQRKTNGGKYRPWKRHGIVPSRPMASLRHCPITRRISPRHPGVHQARRTRGRIRRTRRRFPHRGKFRCTG